MNSLKSLAMNCGPLSEMIRGRCVGELLARPLDDRLDVGLGHALADLPVDDEPAAAVEQAAEVEERAGDVDVGDIDVPVLVRRKRLLEAFPLSEGLRLCSLNQPRA